MRKFVTQISFFITLCIVLVGAKSLLGPGFLPTHDGEYHIIRFYEFTKMLQSGVIYPRWAAGLNSGYGVPLFNFHYPLPNYVGFLFTIFGTSYADAVKGVLAAGYVTAATFCFAWLRKKFSSPVAAIGTIAGAFVPYWFVDIYVRGSVGEALAVAFFFFALTTVEYRWRYLLPFAVAGLILSHNIQAIIFLPILSLYILGVDRSLLWAVATGICLAAFFWIPALLERPYVVGLNSTTFSDHFPEVSQLIIPSWGTGFSKPGVTYDEMSQQIGIVACLALFSGVWFGLRQSAARRNRVLVLFILVSIVCIILMLPVSLWVWRIFAFLQYIQYPWRLLSVFIPGTAFFVAFFVHRTNIWKGIGIAVLAILTTYSYTNPVLYEPRSNEYYLSKVEFTDGTSSLGNSFSPKWSTWQPHRAITRFEVLTETATIDVTKESPLSYTATVSSSASASLRAHIAYYPGWTVTSDGQEIPIQYESSGFVDFKSGPGTHTVKVFFKETTLRLISDWISLVALFCLLGSAILKGYAYRDRHIPSTRRP